MKDVRHGGNVDESRFLSYYRRRCVGRWLRALAALCLALTMAGELIVLGEVASGASALVPSVPSEPCSGPSLQAAAPESCPGAPTLLIPTAGDGTVTLSWAAPASDGGLPITGYNVYQGTSPGGEAPGAIYTSSPATSSYTVTGLKNGTTYYFTLTAVNNYGEGLASNEVSATPTATPPGAPTGLTAVAGNGTVTLAWTAPAGGLPITGYHVYQGTSPAGESGTPVNGSSLVTATSYRVTGLTNGTTYYFMVSASNRTGQGPTSNEVKAVPGVTATVPGAPSGLAVTPGDGKVTLSWTAPGSDGGSRVTGYNVYYATSADFRGAAEAPGIAGTALVLEGLVNGTTYYFRVTAVNGVGEGQPSSTVPAIPLGVPGAPAGLAATAGNGKVTLAWAAPGSDGGSRVTGFNVYQGTSAGGEARVPVNGSSLVTATSYKVTGLANGTTYYFTVTAVNRVGQGPASTEVKAVPATAPGAPAGLAVTPGNGKVTLSWTAPGSDGGSRVTGYNVYYATSADFRGATRYSAGTSTAFVLVGLVNGTTYYFRVTAVNGVGEGQPSSTVPAIPLGVPGSPAGLAATAGNGKVTLSWTAPGSDGGSRVTGYNVYRGTSAGGEARVPVNGSLVTGTSYQVTGLVNGTAYYFRVAAVNRVGQGPASAEATAVPAAVPGAPAGLTAKAGDGRVTLSWVPPASDGGSRVTGFNVYRGTSAGGEARVPVNGSLVTGTSYQVTGLVNGTAYYFRVTAVNRVGQGPASAEAKVIPVAVPGAPAGLTATPGDARVILSWTAPPSDGGWPVTGYNVYAATSADFKDATKVTRGTGTALMVTGLVNGTTYYFKVTAVNRIGEGPASAAAKTVPATVPGAPVGLTATPGKSKVALAWTAPPSGGSPITGYIIYKGTSPGGETGPAVNGSLVTATSYTVTGLVNGTPYYFEVFAVNAVGQGPSSKEAPATLAPVSPTRSGSPGQSASTPARRFSGPTGLTATAGDTKVHLSWTAPASDGGSPVTGYKIYLATTPDAQQSTTVGTAKGADATVTHLVNGTTYYFMVTAVNTAGNESPLSTEVSAKPVAAIKSVPLSSPTVPPQLIALITTAAAMVTAAGFTLITRGRARFRSRKHPHSKHSRQEMDVGSDVRAVADAGRLDAVSVRDTGQEPTHTVRFEPHPGVSTTTIKEGRP